MIMTGCNNSNQRKTILVMMFVIAGLLTCQPANAIWSHKEGDPKPENIPSYLLQPFSEDQWNASNFASEEDVQWFRDAKYGMFLHFGLSTRVNMDISWAVCQTYKAPDVGAGRYPDDVWQSWAKEMKMENFDAREWVDIAKKGGFKYVVLITKHHDGFHMWDTAYSDFKITNTPFGRDIVKEIVDACHDAGMPIGLYYSQRDWYHPDYMPVDPEKVTRDGYQWKLKPGYKSQLGESHQKYLDYQNKVVEELFTKYGKIDLLWWDAAWYGDMFTADMWDAENINRKIRKWQPGIVINNRCSIPGDYDTPEHRLGGYQAWRPWESCFPLTQSWSYSATQPKSTEQIIRMLVNNLCGDGNILLSWGPKWDGEFAESEKQRLFEVGGWLKKNASAVYGTRGGPWKISDWGGSVRRGKKIYLHVLNWKDNTLRLPAIPNRNVISAKLLNGKDVQFKQKDGVVMITVPAELQDVIDTILELTMERSVDDIKAIEAGQASVFADTATYGKIVSLNAKVKTSSACEHDSEGGPQILIGAKPVDSFAFCTAPEMNPWVQIDLGKEMSVTGVRVLNRGDGWQDRAATLRLLTSQNGTDFTQEWKAKSSHSAWEIPVTDFYAGAQVAGKKARYIRLETQPGSPTHFHLRQVQVYGKE